jgi:hypothetical protein
MADGWGGALSSVGVSFICALLYRSDLGSYGGVGRSHSRTCRSVIRYMIIADGNTYVPCFRSDS